MWKLRNKTEVDGNRWIPYLTLHNLLNGWVTFVSFIGGRPMRPSEDSISILRDSQIGAGYARIVGEIVQASFDIETAIMKCQVDSPQRFPRISEGSQRSNHDTCPIHTRKSVRGHVSDYWTEAAQTVIHSPGLISTSERVCRGRADCARSYLDGKAKTLKPRRRGSSATRYFLGVKPPRTGRFRAF